MSDDGRLHYSDLKHMAVSPAHYLYRSRRPYRQTTSMLIGSAVDAIMFESSEVDVYHGRRAGKDWESYRDDAEQAGKLILNRTEHATVMGCVHALRANRVAMKLLQGDRQRALEWEYDGVECAGTPDVFTSTALTELKTTRCAKPERFKWDALRMTYHAQLAWYRAALIECGLAIPQTAYIVAVETAPPYPVTCFELSEQALDQGERTWRLWFERLRVCEESDEWPEYAQSIVPLDFGDPDESFTLRIDGEDVEI